MVANLAICVITNLLTIICMFHISSCLSEKAYNGKYFVHGRVDEVQQSRSRIGTNTNYAKTTDIHLANDKAQNLTYSTTTTSN